VSGTEAPSLRRLTASRDRSRPEWNEDASRAELDADGDTWRAFLVVADGAGSTQFSGEWARALVDGAEPGWLDGGLVSGVARVRGAFDPLTDAPAKVDFVLEDLWHEQGSAATLLAAGVVSDGEGTTCRVCAVGDCVVFVSEAEALTSFPVESSTELTNRTETVKTRESTANVQAWARVLPPGCLLAVASDAIAKWILQRKELEGAGSVHAWLRDVSELDLPEVDDDVTLLVLCVPVVPRPTYLDRLQRLAQRALARLGRW
jgi:Protein phosphatase 2C